MSDRQTMERVIRAAYAARLAGDLDALMAHLTPDVTFRIAGSDDASAVPCQARSLEASRNTLTALVDTFEFADFELVDLVVDGPKAVAQSRVRVRAKATGATAETELLDVIRFEGDRIASFVQFCDTALAAKLLGQEPPLQELRSA
jgi:ketosteroid isomerase-like protein